jgi:DNA-directed RNA polymerase specialized sigma24 family protein
MNLDTTAIERPRRATCSISGAERPQEGSRRVRTGPATAASDADYTLVRRALAGESAALMQLIERLNPVIRARVLRSLSPFGRAGQQEVDDFTQEVFAHLFADHGRALLGWQPSLGLSLEGFVRLLSHHKVVTILRTKSRSPFGQVLEDPVICDERPFERSRSLDSEIAQRERVEQLVERLSGFVSPRGLDVFRRLFIELESPQEVARALDLSLDSVYQWRSRLSKLLRERVGSSPDTKSESSRGTPSPAL